VEDILEPDLPIVDPHHPLWDMPGRRYLFDDLIADVRTEMTRPIGETEFVNGVAAQSASGQYGSARLCAGIVGSLDLFLGEHAAPVLEAHIRAGNGRFCGISGRTAWHESTVVRTTEIPRDMLVNLTVRKTISCIEKAGSTYEIWAYHSQMKEVIGLCRAFPNLSEWSQSVRILAHLPNLNNSTSGK
jgi:L-fuconolactonase